MEDKTVTVHVLGDKDRTVAEARIIDLNRYPVATTAAGSAARRPEDKADYEIGEDLAVARALRSLAARLEKRASGKMKHRDDIKVHRLEIEAGKNLKRLAEMTAIAEAWRDK